MKHADSTRLWAASAAAAAALAQGDAHSFRAAAARDRRLRRQFRRACRAKAGYRILVLYSRNQSRTNTVL